MGTAPNGYNAPKTNWAAGNVPTASDFNRIEGNINAIESGSRTIDPAQAPSGNTGTLRQLLDWFANRFKAITGKANWWDTPVKSIQQLADDHATHLANRASASALGHVRIGSGLSIDEDGIISVPTEVPAGVVAYFARSTPPTGWLKCNGAAVSRTTYANLFAVIGTTFGSGDGTTTFNLPDLRGEFLRGWDDGRGVDSGRTFGSLQTDAFKSHEHPLNRSGGGTGTLWGVSELYVSSNIGPRYVSPGATQAQGGTETRPRNIALLACIKY